MKKYFILIIISFVTFSCSKDSNEKISKSQLIGTWKYDITGGFIGEMPFDSVHVFYDLTFTDTSYLLITQKKFLLNNETVDTELKTQEGTYSIKSKFIELIPNSLYSWGEFKEERLIFRSGLEKDFVFKKSNTL